MAASGAARSVPLWKNRDYLLLWFGHGILVLGSSVSQLAFPLLVLARSIPWLLFALPAGALVDRWDRKLTMSVCGLGGGLALASVPVAYAFAALTIPQIVVVSFVEGTFAIVFGLAETSALPQVVARAQLPTVVAQQQAQYGVGSLLGPPLGGALFGLGRMLPFLVDALSYALAACSPRFVRANLSGLADAARRPLRVEIAEGLGWLWGHPLVRYMAFLTGTLNFAAGLNLIIIVLLQRQGATPTTIGALFAVAGAGGVIGALIAPRIQRRFSFGQAIIGLCWFYALVYALFAATSSVVLITAILTAFFFFSPTYDTVQMSYRLAIIPDALQGRVNSVFRLIAQGLRPLGLGLTGILIERWGVAGTTLTFAAVLAAMALVTTLNSHVRAAPALAEVAA
jgi:predicted MFS family arabinose efflux permease